jgi:hypothetical protein
MGLNPFESSNLSLSVRSRCARSRRVPEALREPNVLSERSASNDADPSDREFIRDRPARMALTLLRFHLLGVPPRL